ncbi:hypothetical protein [Embleya sp. NBC_00896]|uniref:hypothetical protein n=1 Tax=Embleya sp. NBC_00896 TaxID=2975961 RepID=UPI00386E6197|nr:hypothetical protein OG928_07730 [Embleya sp. NBC_00896]
MGSFGVYVVARSAWPLLELPAVQQAGGEPEWSARDGDWQVLLLSAGLDPGPSLMADTDAPVLTADVVYGHFAMIDAQSPRGGDVWHCALAPRAARSYALDAELGPPPEWVLPRAVGWAREAGLDPDETALDTTLRAEGRPDDLLRAFLDALGFRFVSDVRDGGGNR